ncbi:amino acid adenylation domain-containing protein [Streptomyces sp. NPDC056500]|uniref:amino acid adenylation domain-containing protein n=1 Tax=Streptomyces sp. NPDC056500 TaxID=3345840 RepID=UPI0036B7506F
MTRTYPTPVDDVVAAIREACDGRQPGADDPVLPSGADSMTAVRLALALEDRLGVPVPLSWLRAGHNATALAGLAAEARGATSSGRRLTAPSGSTGHDEPFAPTALQQAYLVGKEDDLVPDAVGCHHYREFGVSGLDVDRLQRAWAAVQARHPMLRCGLTTDGELQVRAEQGRPPTVHSAGQDPGEVRARLSQRRYSVADWPLHEMEVTPLPRDEWVVHLAVDGLICDGRSLRIVLRDLWRVYEGIALAPDPEAVSFRDFARAVAEATTGDRYADDLRYWEGRLTDLPAGPGTVHSPAREDSDVGGGPERIPLTGSLGPSEWARLREVAVERGVTATALLLGAFCDTLAAAGAALPFSLVLTTSDRARMRGTDDTVGTFTSTMVLPVFDTDVHVMNRHLAEDLEHGTVPGVAALRRRRGRVPELPVVFTSMLDEQEPAEGFAAAECHAVGRTAGVSLDHQVWEADGALRIRWDVVERAFTAPGARALFDAYLGRLRALAGSAEPAVHPLNDLQQAYVVARELGAADAGGCRLQLSYGIDDLDHARLTRALERLVFRHPVLSAEIDTEHGLRLPRRAAAPPVPEVPLTPQVGRDLLRQPFPLGKGHLDVRVGRAERGADVVFLTVDLALVDARSIHLAGRELMALYAADNDGIGGVFRADPREVLPAQLDESTAREHWRQRVTALPTGPRLPAVPDDGTRRRLCGSVSRWPEVVAAAAERGCSPDGLLLAAFARAISPGLGDVFALPVVRWSAGSDTDRPAEATALSWVTVTADGSPLLDLARRYDGVLGADRGADVASGLAELRRSRRADSAMPVVYTSIFDLTGHPLPDGVTTGDWATTTPGVALDCVATLDGDVLEFAWDALEEQLPGGWLDGAFLRFAAEVAGLSELAKDPPDDSRLPPARWNDTSRPFPADLPVQCLIEDQARIRPSQVAVRWAGGALTYAELELRANRLAWTLREAGVGRGDVIGVSVRRGPDMVVAVLGILKAGGAYLPVLPSLPRDRAAVMLGDAAAHLLLWDKACAWATELPGVRPIDLDEVLARPHERESTAPEPANDVDDLAYVIFTSGSTGRPKGVAVTHRPMLNLFEWCQRTFGFGPGDLGLSVTSLGFDLSVFDIFGLLSMGAALYVADEEQQRDPQLLLRVLLTEPVTFWNSAPTTLAHLAPEFAAVSDRRTEDTLRLVFLSGDYTPLWLPDQLRAAFPGATLVSLGGATEATVWSNYFVVDRVDPQWRSIPYGRPIDNSRYHVLDDSRRPVPIGVEGDLYIAGACLASGYYRQPALTEERFVTGDFPGVPETRMYATGDRARYGPDGVLHFLGRCDGQVKVRGFRVELPEIEHRLRTHPGVEDAVVLLRKSRSGEERLVAYVLPDGPPPCAEEVRAHAAAALPDYMVPGVVAFVPAWPATTNGKLDRDALPWPIAPTTAPTDDTADATKPIAAMFGELLDLPPVDPAADLWDLGATSFTMVRASRMLRERYGREVPVAVLLAEPTVAAIARHMSGTPQAPAVAPPPSNSSLALDPPLRSDTLRTLDPPPTSVAPPRSNVSPAFDSPPDASPAFDSSGRGAEPAQVDFFAEGERRRFKEGDFGQRPRSGRTLALTGDRPTEAQRRWRSSRRPVVERALEGARLGQLLKVLARTSEDSGAGSLYPSAGDTCSVQVYVLVRKGAVDGLEGGAYYYRPREHALEPLDTGVEVPVNAHVFYNRPFAARAAAEIYLIGELQGIEPLYGAQAPRYLALEAGHMAQLLMQQQVPSGVALCPVGDLRRSDLTEALGLGSSHSFQLGFLCAPLDATGENDSVEPLWTTASAPPRQSSTDIAVVGMAGRFPGAGSPNALWRLLHEGRSAIGPMTPERVAALGWSGPPPVGGFLDALGAVDLRPLRISPAEADVLDPQLRMLLPTVWECLERAGHTPRSLADGGARVGVFVASMWDDHLTTAGDGWERDGTVEVVATRATVPNRLSHTFGWQGPSMAVDTSCSSSLTALHLAINALRAGDCDSAVVAGVNLVTHRRHVGLLSALGLLADREAVRPGVAYDGAAPGWYVGEAVGALLLRRADTAARDVDQVLGVLEESWCGHAGGIGRFGAPGPAPLMDSLARLLRSADLEPTAVSYVESAAAGASLADAAEVAAFHELFGDGSRPVPMGTVKPNIGHAEAAAGIAQLMKVMLQLRHGRIAPTLVSEQPNPLVEWDGRAVYAPRRAMEWAADRGGRRAIVNAVGSGGSYGHVVVREAGGSR